VELILSILLAPVQFFFIWIDKILSLFGDFSIIPSTLHYFISFIGTIPDLIVYTTGVNPILWNGYLLILIGFLSMAPAIQGVKFVLNLLVKIRQALLG